MARLIDQNFEGTGFDNGETWFTGFDGGSPSTGVVDPDYTTAPLRGSQSLRMKDDANYGGWAVTQFAPDGSPLSAIYGFCRFKILDLPSSDGEFLAFYTLASEAVTNVPVLFHIKSNGKLYIWTDGGTSADSTTTLSVGTEYYMWWYLQDNGPHWVKISTDGNIPGTNDIYFSSANWDSNINGAGITTLHAQGYEYLVDQYVISDDVIGDMVDAVAPSLVKKYRTGATQAACEAASWTTYSGPFTSLGYVQVRLEA